MSRGIKIIGDESNIQIDNKYANYVYYDGGTTTLISGTNYISFTPTTDKVIFGVSPTTSGVVLNWGVTTSGSYYTGCIVKSNATQEVDYNVFIDNQTPTLSGTYGLKIYKDNGDVAFDSRNKYFKIVAIREVTVTSDSDVNVSVASADNFFVLQDYYYAWDLNISGGEAKWVFYSKGVKKINNTTIALSTIAVNTIIESDSGTGFESGSGGTGPFNIIEIKKI